MASLAQFRAQFPEFSPAAVSDPLVVTFLAAAALELSQVTWGPFGTDPGVMTKADQAQMYLAAHKLALSPNGQNARMVPNPKAQGYAKTNYGVEFVNLRMGVTSGYRVA